MTRVGRRLAGLADVTRRLFRRFQQWHQQAHLHHQLLDFNDHMLRDIGITEFDIKMGHPNRQKGE
jgi:uncharacterized protein YjiS (DUF1127 family)